MKKKLENNENALFDIVGTNMDYQVPMDIYSKKGTEVIYTGKGGYDHDIEYANKHLMVGETYTVDYTDVYDWYTKVYLKEVPNKGFNSVHFIKKYPEEPFGYATTAELMLSFGKSIDEALDIHNDLEQIANAKLKN